MQRHLLAAIAAMGIALAAGTTGYGAEPPVADEDEPLADIGTEHAAVAPKDRKDVPIAVDPLKPEASEGIAANPKHPASLVAAASTHLTAATQGPCLVYRSSDGGRTWSMPVPLPQIASGTCEHADVAYAPDGSRVYAAYSSYESDILISSSKDNGATWDNPPVIALQGHPDNGNYRSPRIATALQTNEPNYVYLIARRWYGDPGQDIFYTRSADFGGSWSEPRVVARGSSDNFVSGAIAGGAAGEVLVVWSNSADFFFPDPASSVIKVMRSGDYGLSFDSPVTAVTAPNRLIRGFLDAKIGGKGAAHVVYSRYRNTSYDRSDIEYIWSPGPPYTTWSKPVIVNNLGPHHRNSAPSLTTQQCGASTVLHLVWEDERRLPATFSTWNVYYSRKLAKPGAGWTNNVRVSGRSSFGHTEDVHPDVAVGSSGPFAVWTDWRDKTDPSDIEADVYGSGIVSGITCR